MNKLLLMTFFIFIMTVQAYAYFTFTPNMSARAAGMGGAFTALADDANAAIYNPAGINFVHNGQLAAGYYYQPLGADSDAFSASGAFRAASGTFGYNADQIDMRVTLLSPTREATFRMQRITLTYSRILIDDLSVGANVNRFYKGIVSEDEETGSSVDIGALFKQSEQFSAGIMYESIFADRMSGGSAIPEEIPPYLRLGACYSPFKTLRLTFDARKQVWTSVNAGDNHIGFEHDILYVFTIRCGYREDYSGASRQSSTSIGFSYNMTDADPSGLHLDSAHIYTNGEASNLFSLRWDF